MKERARTHPKPLFYNPLFIAPKLAQKPDAGTNIAPLDFARPLFPQLLEFRKPRYQAITEKFGFTICADELFQQNLVPDPRNFLDKIYANVTNQAEKSEGAAGNLKRYLSACARRAENRDTH